MGAGALFVDLVKKMLRRRALVPAEMRALKWGVLRMLGLVDPPVNIRHRDPTLMEETVLDDALQCQRRVMVQIPEEGMTPGSRYSKMEVFFADGRHDGKPIEFLSKEDAWKVERETAKRSFRGADGRWKLASVDEDAPEDETGRKKE